MATTISTNNGKSSECGIFFPYKIASICVWKLEYGLDVHPIYRDYLTCDHRD